MRFKLLLLVFFLLFAGFAFSATYNVSITGSDSNPGSEAQPFRTIQKCTGMVSPGDSCIVSAGGYNENVNLSRGGSAGSPVTFKANGAVVTSQINISAPYVIVDGFDITGTSEAVAWRGMISVGTGAHYCQILNNTLHDVPFDSASGIEFNKGGNLPSQSAGHCIVKGNIIKDIGYVSLFLFGDSHLIENNTFDGANGGGFDVIQPFGAHHIFRGNYFTNMWENGHHTDIIQTFGNNGDSAYDIIFENNTITNSEAQLCNLSQDGIADIRDWTFRNNLLVNVAYSCNVYIPNVSFYNNTFINTRIDTIFLNINQNDARNAGAASNARVFNNLFVDSGMHANNSLYSVGAGVLSTFQANNNYIAGSPPEWEVKNNWTDAGGSGSNLPAEPNGINGGDPLFMNSPKAFTRTGGRNDGVNLSSSFLVFDRFQTLFVNGEYIGYEDDGIARAITGKSSYGPCICYSAFDVIPSDPARCGNIASNLKNCYLITVSPALSDGRVFKSNSIVDSWGTNNSNLNKDFRIRSGSQAIGRGANLSSTGFNADNEGNPRPASGAWTIGAFEYTGIVPPDTIPPVTTASPAGGTYTSAKSVVLSRTESGTTYYCIGSGCSPTTAYSVPVQISTSNTLRFYSVDLNSNVETVKQEAYTINIDSQSPSVPSNLAATAVSSSQINLSWSASSDNVDVVGYKIFRSLTQAGTFVLVGSSSTNSHSDSNGLSASTTYYYKVSAFDAAGNESSQSSVFSATTLEYQAPQGLILWITADDDVSDGVATDSGGNSLNATCSGSDCPLYSASGGKFGGAYQFNGVQGKLTLPVSPILRLASHTKAAWIKLASYKTGSYNMLFGDEVGDYFGLRSNGTQWRAGYTNGSGVAVYGDLTGSLISLDSWHHVAFAYTVSGNTVNIKYYLDGVLQSGQINGSAGFTPKALLRIANYSQSTGAPLNGLVDDVRVYDSALSQQEIQAMMAGDTPPPTCLDLTSDSKVDLFDLVFVSLRLGNPAGDAADVLGNDGVNIQDLQKIAGHFGQDC